MKKSKGRTLNFIKRNAVYLVLGFCIIAVGISITFMLMQKQSDLTLELDDTPVIEQPVEPEKPDDEQVNKPVVFNMPVLNPTAIGDYGDTMVFNSTLGRFSAHLAIDFFAPEGTPVLAVFDGTVHSVETTLLTGTTVVIDHGNGLYSVYNSLADGDEVVVGQTVSQGDKIGEVSVTNRQEYKDGAHLHFEVIENGDIIDPAKYLMIEEK